ncbi:hypothetical protein VULLAG_LOCUS6790 [Vulpes lagopus]
MGIVKQSQSQTSCKLEVSESSVTVLPPRQVQGPQGLQDPPLPITHPARALPALGASQPCISALVTTWAPCTSVFLYSNPPLTSRLTAFLLPPPLKILKLLFWNHEHHAPLSLSSGLTPITSPTGNSIQSIIPSLYFAFGSGLRKDQTQA